MLLHVIITIGPIHWMQWIQVLPRFLTYSHIYYFTYLFTHNLLWVKMWTCLKYRYSYINCRDVSKILDVKDCLWRKVFPLNWGTSSSKFNSRGSCAHPELEKKLWVQLDTTENWKYCSKIIFKCVNSTVRPIFNEKVAEKWSLWVPWTVHRTYWCALFMKKINIHGLKKKKKNTNKRRRRCGKRKTH